MEVININGKTYAVVITQDEHGAEIGLWHGDQQLAAIVVDEEGVSVHGQ